MFQMGIRVLRIKSDNPHIIAVYLGPSQIAASIAGTKLNPIDKNDVLIDKNLDNTIESASNNADKIIFFVFDIFCIKKTPFKRAP